MFFDKCQCSAAVMRFFLGVRYRTESGSDRVLNSTIDY